MFKPAVLVVTICILPACAAMSPPEATLANWQDFVERTESMSPPERTAELAATQDRYKNQPSDETRLNLAYLLNQSSADERDPEQVQALLAEVDADSPFAPLRDLLAREIALTSEIATGRQQLADLRAEITSLQTQLDALKEIETDLKENQKDLEELTQ